MTDEITKQTPVTIEAAARAAGAAATATALTAIGDAAANAAKPGGSTTEFKATAGAIVLTALVAGLKVFAILPGPWTLPAAIGLAAVTAATASYSLSRGSVKKAALGAAAAVTSALAHNSPRQPESEVQDP